MNRTPRKNAFKSGLVYDDAEYQDAYRLLYSEGFKETSRETERDPITCLTPIAALLDGFADAAGSFKPAQEQYAQMEGLCRDKQGCMRPNPVLEHLEQQIAPLETGYWNALTKLGDALTVELLVSVKEALSLAGVTDDAVKDEICRCVVRGGNLHDGGPAGSMTNALSKDASTACPHCGQGIGPDTSRCSRCERLIG